MSWVTLLLLITGFFLCTYFVRSAGLAERAAYALLFSMVAVPFVAINIALLFAVYIGKPLLLGVCVAFLAALSVHIYRYLRDLKLGDVSAGELALVAGAVPVAVFFYFYYSNLEVIWSLGSFLQTGKSSCFTMQTYKLVEQLNPGANPSHIPQIYSIISTPGNVMYTGSLMPLFGIRTFHYLYVLFQINLYLFAALLVYRWSGRAWLAVATGLLAVLNPYSLSVEILDRNLIALSVGAALLYTVYRHRKSHLLHGLLFGITAGAGLRFLPLTYILPIALLYVRWRVGLRGYLALAAGFVITFTFNVPHLFHHGFHSLGHSEPFWELLATALGDGRRTPLVPFPNFVFYAVNALSYWGYALAALALFGAGAMALTNRLRFVVLVLVALPTYLVLGAQPDWIEIDKARIALSGLLPLVLFAGHGVDHLLRTRKLARDAAVLVALPLVVALAGHLLGGVAGAPDMTFYDRKQIYQQDPGPYAAHARESLARVGALPNPGRLMNKVSLERKRAEERVALGQLLSRPVVARNAWVARWLPAREQQAPRPRKLSAEHVVLRVDLDRLVSDEAAAVSVVPACKDGRCFLDLKNKKDLLDIYYRAVKVSWQRQPLPVTVLTGKPELEALGELNLELNAFIGYGKDEYGFERVNLINYMTTKKGRAYAKKSGMTALPHRDRTPVIRLRVPRDITLVIRNWIVAQEQGVPHRIDSWRIRIGEDGKAVMRFFFQEPESYF